LFPTAPLSPHHPKKITCYTRDEPEPVYRLRGSHGSGGKRPSKTAATMVEDQKVQEFIALRSRGLSFGRIAEQLGVAKSTLINWSRQHQHLIQNLRTIEWEDFVDRTLASK
jgi:hypothetical protein